MNKKIFLLVFFLFFIFQNISFASDPFIRDIQVRLSASGFIDSTGDGAWDEKTKKAVASLQKKYNIPVSGELTSETLEIIFASADTNDLYRSYSKAIRSNSRGSAEKYLDLILLKDPKHFNALQFKARLLASRKEYEKAKELYLQCVDINKNNKLIRTYLGHVQCELGEYSDAEISFKKAIEIAVHEPVIYHNRGLCRLNMGLYHPAEEDFNKESELLDEMPQYELFLVRQVLKQLDGIDLPPAEWRPDYRLYSQKKEIESFNGYLISQVKLPLSMESIKPDEHTANKKLSFKGSEKKPFLYAPNLEVWKGALITDKDHGILLENGTHFKLTQISAETNIKKISTGVVENWKMVFKNEVETGL